MIDSDGSGSTGVQAGRVVLSPEQQRSQRSCLPLTHLSQVCASFQTLNSLTLSWELEIGCGGGPAPEAGGDGTCGTVRG